VVLNALRVGACQGVKDDMGCMGSVKKMLIECVGEVQRWNYHRWLTRHARAERGERGKWKMGEMGEDRPAIDAWLFAGW